MLDRRRFFLTLGGLVTGVAIPLDLAEFSDLNSLNWAAALPVSDEIRAIEQMLQLNPGHFNWWAHNELRHLYLAISEQMSRKHADTLLAYSVMDSYILNTLSDWHMTHTPADPQKAITVLVNNAEQYWYFPHLRAACLIMAGDIYRGEKMEMEAQALYRQVMAGVALPFSMPSFETYQRLAGYRLSQI
jgi:hypothetical protein